MKLTSLTILLFSTFFYFAQSQKKVEEHQFSLNILLPGATYEFGVGNESRIAASVAFGLAYRESDIFDSGFGVYPIGFLQYRMYTNFNRREIKGKNIQGNSGDYFAPTALIQGGNAIIGDLDFSSNIFGGAAAVYGLQRTGKKGFQFNIEFGPAYLFDDFSDGIGLYFDLKLGFVLGKKH